MFRALLVVVLLMLSASSFANPLVAEPEMRPECGTMVGFGDAMTGMSMAIVTMGMAMLTTVTPDVGLAVGETPALQLSWPLTYAFGWASGQTVIQQKCAKDIVLDSPVNRVMLEPILRFNSDPVEASFWLRPGYRFLWRESDALVGFGAGIGSTLTFDSGVDASLSPELVLSFGECCFPGYATLAARWDRYFERELDIFTIQLGWTYD